MYTKINGCRACGYGSATGPGGIKNAPPNEKLISVLNLGVQPLANDFKDNTQEHSGCAPLELMWCPRCTLAQLSVVVRPDILYANYPYITSRSQMMQEHFKWLWKDISDEQTPKHVVEIGSNDGQFLKFCKEQGSQYVLGVDPAENLARVAESEGVPTLTALFGNGEVAERIKSKCCDPDVVVARHVFCHVDNWRGFIRGLEVISEPHTLVCIEVPYIMDMLKNAEFDTIYHEHLSYLSLKSVIALLEGTRFYLHHVIHYPIHGGAILLMLRRREHSGQCDVSVDETLANEKITRDSWELFNERVTEEIGDLQAQVNVARTGGKTVCGYGASAKSTVWINACGFNRQQIQFVTDDTPQKQYKFIPGRDIPVVDPGALLRELPDYAILFAWNYRREILEKETLYQSKGGKFIVPHENERG